MRAGTGPRRPGARLGAWAAFRELGDCAIAPAECAGAPGGRRPGRGARRAREPQVVPGRPFSSPFPFSRRPPSRPCRRHFPRFLLPLQSGGREGAAALSCLQTSSGTHRGRPGTAPGTSSAALLRSPGGGTSPRGTRLGSPSCPRASSPPGLVPAATAPGLSFVLDADPRPSPSGPGVNAVIAGPRRPACPAMPFHQRSVEPARLCRPEEAAVARAAGAPLFRSLEQVSSHTLVCLLAQLADLSRCAGDIFGELEGQAAALGHRTAELHRRLDALHAAAARLDHRRVKIRECLMAPGRAPRHRGSWPAAASRPLAAQAQLSGLFGSP
ncbi:Actin-binding protein WASF2 [Lemmus lemmus]